MPDHQSHTTVLIVGGGYAGLAASVFLSAHGVPSVLADRHPAASVQGAGARDAACLADQGELLCQQPRPVQWK
jgi:glycine/D-amino acid oxidase-like deaminating enzyme